MPPALTPIRRKGLDVFHAVPFFTSPPEAGAQCGSSARWDLCGGLPERAVPTATVYVRRHGPGGRYRGGYTSKHIAADAERIRGWLHAGKDVSVYYNNDVDGYAVDNARQLVEAIE